MAMLVCMGNGFLVINLLESQVAQNDRPLAWLQCSQDILGIPALPPDLLNLRKSLLHCLKGNTFATFAKHKFDPPHPAVPLVMAIPHPQSRWNRYFCARRRKRHE